MPVPNPRSYPWKMTLSSQHNQHQIVQAQPAYVVVEEEYDIERYSHKRRNNWVWVIALLIGGIVGLFWNSGDEAEVALTQPVQQIADIPSPSVKINEIQELLLYEGTFIVNQYLVTTTTTLQQDNEDFLWVFSVDKTSVDYHIGGYVNVGYDLSQASALDDGEMLHVFLPAPQVFAVDVVPDLSYFDIDIPTHGEITAETLTVIMSIAEEALIAQAYADGLVAEVNNSGPQVLEHELFQDVDNLVFHTQAPTGVSQ